MSAIWVRSSNEMTDWLTNVVCVLFLELFIDKIEKNSECKKIFALFYGNVTTFKGTNVHIVAYRKIFKLQNTPKYLFDNSLKISLYRRGVESFLNTYLGKWQVYWIFSTIEQLLFHGKRKRIYEFIVYAWVAVFDLPMSQNLDKK